MAVAVIRDALLVLALAPLFFYALAIFAGWRFFRFSTRPANSPDFFPPVSVLKPIHGLDREAYENFASLCRQDYPEFEIHFCVTNDQDPALPVLRRVIEDFPGRTIRLWIGAEPIGVSDKVNKLARMAREARHDILIVSDSDVRVDPGFLRGVVAPFADPATGGVTCLYRGLTDGSPAAELEALGNSSDFAPGVLVARMLGDVDFMLGAVMAVTRRGLEEIGGFAALADYFCDDYELGNRIARRGHRIELSRVPVSIVYPHETLREAFRHQLRWNLSIRFSRPAGHAGMLFSMGLPWAVLAALLAPRASFSAAYLAAYAVLRLAVAWVVGVAGLRDSLPARKFWLLPVRDAFAFLVWAVSFFPQRIHWRGQEFYVRQKRLIKISPRV